MEKQRLGGEMVLVVQAKKSLASKRVPILGT
jgi:hypothetical protein